MISCQDFLREIGDYLDGDVAVEVRAKLEKHLAMCRTCTVLVDSSKKTVRVVTDSDSYELAPEAFRPIAEEVMRRIRKAGSGG